MSKHLWVLREARLVRGRECPYSLDARPVGDGVPGLAGVVRAVLGREPGAAEAAGGGGVRFSQGMLRNQAWGAGLASWDVFSGAPRERDGLVAV